jgi:hypothetical protein
MFIDLEKGENVVQTSFDCLFTSYKEKKWLKYLDSILYF